MKNGQCYCFNPKCLLPSSRVFTECHPHYYLDQCEKWRVSKKELLSYSQYKLPFREDQPLLFVQKPIKMLAYTYFNRDQICRYLRNYCQNIIDEIMKGVEEIQAKFQNIIQNFQMMDQFQEIRNIALGNLSNKEKIQRIHAFSENYQTKQNLYLPSKLYIRDFVSFNTSFLQKMSNLKPFQYSSGNIMNLNKLEALRKEQVTIKSQINNYIRSNSNLGTISFLFREDPQKFIIYDDKSNLVAIKCIFCDHFVKISCSKKKIAYKLASDSFLEHTYNIHFNLLKSSYLHRVTGFAVRQLKISDIKEIAEDEKVKKVIIIDRSFSQYFQHKINPKQFSIAIQILYLQQKPHSDCAYYRGYNPKSFLLLIGQIIQIIAIQMKKTLVIYTNQIKKEIINEFCSSEKIQNVNIIVGAGKKQVNSQKQVSISFGNKTIDFVKENCRIIKNIDKTIINDYQQLTSLEEEI